MPDEFELARLLSLRAFDVVLRNGGTPVRVFAHLHDGGQNPQGHLNFITIDRDGHQKISRTFNTRVWDDLQEVASEIPSPAPPVTDDGEPDSGEGEPDPVIPRKLSRGVH